MENDSLKNIEKYLFEMVTYMRISILIGIISVVYLIYTINTSKAYLGEDVSNAVSADTKDSVLPIILFIAFFWVGVYLLFKNKNTRKD